MITSTRVRLGAIAAAAAVVAGGLLAAVPANAATGTLTVANSTYTTGSWGAGIDITGAGFSADAVVTITATQSTFVGATTAPAPDTVDVTADATGAFAKTTFVPKFSPLGGTVTLTATSDKTDTANTVTLSVLAPKGIAAESTSITTADLTDPNTGIVVTAGGYTPGETVTAKITYNGQTLTAGTYTVAADGSISLRLWLVGTAVPGTATVTITGGTSGLTQSVDVQVTGDPATTTTDDPGTVTVGTDDITTIQAPAQAKNLPVVSG